MVVSIKIRGLRRTRNKLGRFTKGVNNAIIKHSEIAAKKIANDAQFFAAGGLYSSGFLADSIRAYQTQQSSFSSDWVVEAGAPYANIVEGGARPHTITGNPYLHFFWLEVGDWVTMSSVNHPGFEGKRFMQKAIDKNAEKLRENFKLEIQSLVKQAGGRT